MPRKLADADLVAYSDEHLLREINMLWQAVDKTQPGKTGLDSTIAIECFALHLRNLIEFFCYEPHSNYVRASAFFDDPAKWPARLTPTLTKALDRANKEVNHLTTDRVDGTPPGKEWDIAAPLAEIEQKAREFVSGASPNKLGPQVRALFQKPTKEIRVWLGDNATYSNSTSQTTTSSPGAPPRGTTPWRRP